MSKNNSWRCEFCETINSEESLSCAACGRKRNLNNTRSRPFMKNPGAPEPPEPKKPEKKKTGVIIRALLVLALILGGIILWQNGGSKASAAPSGKTGIKAVYGSETTTIGLRHDGTVAAAGNNQYGQCEVSRWRDIVDIIAADDYTVGLKADGSLVWTGNLTKDSVIGTWRDIKEIEGSGVHIVGLRKDGKVLDTYTYMGKEQTYNEYIIHDWTDVEQIQAGVCGAGAYTIGFCKDGTVEPLDYKDSVSFDSSGWLNIGLQKNGTITVGGIDGNGLQEQVRGWTDIVQVIAGDCAAFGLKSDGTVIYASSGNSDFSELENWHDIKKLYSNHENLLIGLKSDGTLIANNRLNGECDIINSWTDIDDIPFAGYTRILGLKSDGTVVAAGNNDYGQSDLQSFNN